MRSLELIYCYDVHSSVCPSVCLRRACIVIIRCTLAQIKCIVGTLQCSGHPDTKACPPTPSRLLHFHLEERWDMDKCKLDLISQERLKIEVKLLLSYYRKSYMSRQLAQEGMTFSDLECPFHASRAISAVAELLVQPRTQCKCRHVVFVLLCIIECKNFCKSQYKTSKRRQKKYRTIADFTAS